MLSQMIRLSMLIDSDGASHINDTVDQFCLLQVWHRNETTHELRRRQVVT